MLPAQNRREDENLEVAVKASHDLDFLCDYVRPLLMKS